MKRFLDAAPYTLRAHRPSTGRGCFDVLYWPDTLLITVRCRFYFVNSDPEEWGEGIDPAATTWTKAESAVWKTGFLTSASNAFSFPGYRIFCHKKWWELVSALVKVEFTEELEDPYFELNVVKIPRGSERQCFIGPPGLHKAGEPGQGQLHSESLKSRVKAGGTRQRAAIHEAGHTLGLGDEYVDETRRGISHNRLVEEEFGRRVPVADDGRLMSVGDKLIPEYGVVFLEAMRKATSAVTREKDWHLYAASPAHIPHDPERINDLVPGGEQVAV